MCVCACVCGCVGVLVCEGGIARATVNGYAGVGVWVWGVCGWVRAWVCGRVGVLVCECVGAWVS